MYADRPRNTWRHRDREVAMTSETLDIENVISAGRGHGWTGAPIGTTIGHMHLHVGSLQEADAFYHRGLGFDKTVWTYPGALFFSAGGSRHHLVRTPGPLGLRQQTIRRACSSGSSSSRAKRMPLQRLAAFVLRAIGPRMEVWFDHDRSLGNAAPHYK